MIESTTIDRTQANRSIISTEYKDAPQSRSIEPQTLRLLGFKAQLNQQQSTKPNLIDRAIILTGYKDAPQ